MAVPPTLHASLVARLDRIGATAREIAQIGAVLGREFSYDLIEAWRSDRRSELQTALAQLERGRVVVLPRHAACIVLLVQACAGAGRCL